jgi:hypothetical protein
VCKVEELEASCDCKGDWEGLTCSELGEDSTDSDELLKDFLLVLAIIGVVVSFLAALLSHHKSKESLSAAVSETLAVG